MDINGKFLQAVALRQGDGFSSDAEISGGFAADGGTAAAMAFDITREAQAAVMPLPYIERARA